MNQSDHLSLAEIKLNERASVQVGSLSSHRNLTRITCVLTVQVSLATTKIHSNSTTNFLIRSSPTTSYHNAQNSNNDSSKWNQISRRSNFGRLAPNHHSKMGTIAGL